MNGALAAPFLGSRFLIYETLCTYGVLIRPEGALAQFLQMRLA
jgi:hypothetical protein